MARFKVLTRDGSGGRAERTLEAPSRADAMTQARRMGGTVISVSQEKARGPAAVPWYKGDLFGGGKVKARLKTADFAIFTRQFSTMISAGINVLECLDVLHEQADDPGFKIVLGEMIEDVRGGTDLSTAMAKHPTVFTRIYINMIKAGEAAGQLDDILARLADYVESSEKLRREIRSAMTYPILSLVMILGITLFLMLFVIPQFESVFAQLGEGIELPMPTKVVLAISRFLKQRWGTLLLGAGGLYFLIRYFRKTETGGMLWDRASLKLPVFGTLFQKVVLSRFSRTFSTLIRSGVEILGALDIVAATAGNRVIEKAVSQARNAISAGESISKPLRESGVFPPMVTRMIAIGEKSGAIEQLLEKIADFYDDQVTAAVDQLTSLIEPLMLAIMGALVGGIVIAIWMPIFKMQQALGK